MSQAETDDRDLYGFMIGHSDQPCLGDIMAQEPVNRFSDDDHNDDEGSDGEPDLADEIGSWAAKHKITHRAPGDLLHILCKKYPSLPKDPRTLLKTSTSITVKPIAGGLYHHFGISKGINQMLYPESIPGVKKLLLQINIDGLPLFKSSKLQFWPILGMLDHKGLKQPFLIGLFAGNSKPQNLDEYMKDFVEEMKYLERVGLNFGDRHFQIWISAIICDAPARAMVKCCKPYNGYFGCDKCTQEGTWYNKVTFQETDATLRTDASFRDMLDENHHTDIPSPLLELDIGMVTQVPLDYMHLVCLGVMRRLLLYWIKGSLTCRLPSRSVLEISGRLLALAPYSPREFARKPRALSEIDRWKATEFRQFFLYTGSFVLKDILQYKRTSVQQELLSDTFYKNFVLLSVSMYILTSPRLCTHYVDYVRELLVFFVREYTQIYGHQEVIYNVHGLVHLADEVNRFGPPR
ncbi:uncharacterized protein LOC143226245 [Tachypleus tridentatus]|uniref:uncharacterized protein LOC143226245 n=1 Tax=Tachypleus tridentatus TaxID=6853 RepID=UPI003FD1D117